MARAASIGRRVAIAHLSTKRRISTRAHLAEEGETPGRRVLPPPVLCAHHFALLSHYGYITVCGICIF